MFLDDGIEAPSEAGMIVESTPLPPGVPHGCILATPVAE